MPWWHGVTLTIFDMVGDRHILHGQIRLNWQCLKYVILVVIREHHICHMYLKSATLSIKNIFKCEYLWEHSVLHKTRKILKLKLKSKANRYLCLICILVTGKKYKLYAIISFITNNADNPRVLIVYVICIFIKGIWIKTILSQYVCSA